MNARAWAIFGMYETQWNVGGMGGLIGWDGFKAANELLIYGYGVRGEELLAEIERLHVMELAQLEIESKKREVKAKQQAADKGDRDVGDLDDFYDKDDE